MKKSIFAVSGISMALMFLFFGIFVGTKQMIFLTLAITALTVCYHFTVRMAIGTVCDHFWHNQLDYRKKMFCEKGFEKKLYKTLQVKRWKDYMPTFNADSFSLKKHSIGEVLGAGCQAEAVHWQCVIASLLSMLFAIPFGKFGIFCATAIAGALVDLVFIIIQRFNRPRLIKAAEWAEKNRQRETETDEASEPGEADEVREVQ